MKKWERANLLTECLVLLSLLGTIYPRNLCDIEDRTMFIRVKGDLNNSDNVPVLSH